MFGKLWSDNDGQDVPEYALMIALILVLTISVIGAIGTDADAIFGQVKNAMETAAAAS
jgi:Flp pilus assembly pilin Flp